MSSPWAVPIAAVLLTAGFLLVVDYADDSEAVNEGFTWERNGDDVTVTGHGPLDYAPYCDGLKTLTIVPEGGDVAIVSSAFNINNILVSLTVQGSVGSIGMYAFYNCDALQTVTVQGSVGSIGDQAFQDCDALTTVTIGGSVDSIGDQAFQDCDALTTVTIGGSVDSIGVKAFSDCDILDTVTITGPISSIVHDAFLGCYELKTLNIACNDPLAIQAGQTENGYIAHNATTVNNVHRYSATYNWADDGKTCTVHMECANSPYHNHFENADVTSTVKIPPTATEMGTTTYSVSGTYDGFTYSDTKDVQDIPCKSGSDGGTNIDALVYIAAAGAIGAVILIGAAFMIMNTRRER